MTKRERVLTTLKHREPDVIPNEDITRLRRTLAHS